MSSGFPRVIVKETDLSHYVDTLLKGISCVAGVTEKGPVGVPQLISSEAQYERVFGGEIISSDFPLLAKRALSYGAVLWISRVAHYENIMDKTTFTAKEASIEINDRGDVSEPTLKIKAKSIGKWGDGITAQICDSRVNEDELFNIKILIDGEEVEELVDLSMDEANDSYVEKTSSIYIDLEDLYSSNAEFVNRPANGTYALTGGDDGDDVTDADFIGSATNATGFYAFDDIGDAIQLAVPGVSSPAVITAGLAYCESRTDMLFVTETPFDLSPQEAVEFRLGKGVYEHAPFSSNYGAMYYPKVLIYDTVKQTSRLVSPVGDVLGVMAANDYNANESYVPAGMRRGRLLNALGVDINVGGRGRLGDANYLCDNQVNPICVFDDTGTVVWGAQTLQKQASLLREVNVRRMMIIIKKAVAAYARAFIHQPNDPRTWHEFYQGLEPKFAEWKSQRWFYDYRIFCDQDANTIDEAKLNTKESIQRGEFRCQIFVKPVVGIKWVVVDAVITRLDVEFNESLSETLGTSV